MYGAMRETVNSVWSAVPKCRRHTPQVAADEPRVAPLSAQVHVKQARLLGSGRVRTLAHHRVLFLGVIQHEQQQT
jgi:hypothetical protein